MTYQALVLHFIALGVDEDLAKNMAAVRLRKK
jgi:hypothetical protein